jgi:hypothetical protein
MAATRNTLDPFIEVAEPLIAAGRPAEEVTAALVYRGLEPQLAAWLVADLQKREKSPGLLRASSGQTPRVPSFQPGPPPLPIPGASSGRRNTTFFSVLLVGAICVVILGFIGLFSLGEKRRSERQAKAAEWSRMRNLAVQTSNTLRRSVSQSVTNPDAMFDTGAEVQRTLEEESKQASGERKQLLQAMAGWMNKVMAMSQEFGAMGTNLDLALNVSDVRTPEGLQQKKLLLERTIQQLEAEQEFFGDMSRAFRKEMFRYKLPPDVVDRMVSGPKFSQGQQGMNQMLAMFAEYAHNGQGVLSLLETNWGEWSVMPSGSLRFTNPEHRRIYERFVSDSEAKVARIQLLQKQMLNAMANPNTQRVSSRTSARK